jgi:hypothetical protein
MFYISNIDTIYILLDIEKYQESAYKILEYLKLEKEKAKLEFSKNAQNEYMLTINGILFRLLPNGAQGYAYILRNNGYEIKIAMYNQALPNFCPIQIRISSEYLWSKGLNDAWHFIYNWVIETFGNIKTEKVSRVDLCTHVSDIDLVSDCDFTYKGKFKKTNFYRNGNNKNALCFGSRNSTLYCRIYNKSLEVRETKKKHWFYDIWQKHGLNIENVWNIEFEIKSEILRKYNIFTVSDIQENIKGLWLYCTTEYICKISRSNSRKERCSIDSDWQKIQNCFENFQYKPLIPREKQILEDAKVLIPSITGNLTSYCARNGIIDINAGIDKMRQDANKYLANKNTNFENEVALKMSKLNDCEVILNE